MDEKTISDFAVTSGIDKRIIRRYFDELEKAGIDWQLFDIETIADELRDFAQTGGRLEHRELRKRLGLPEIVEKTAEEKAREEEIGRLLGDKPGIKNLLRRIYEDPELSKKQKEEIKAAVIGGAPELTTLIALYDGKEQEYARRFLREMIISPTAEIRDLLKGDTLKIRSERGWIKEINDIPLKKAVRSIDFVEHLKDFELLASQPDDGTIAVYKRKEIVPVVKPELPKPVEKPPEPAIKIPEAKIGELVTQYSYAEVLEKAQEHKIPSGPKAKMLSELLKKGVL